VFTCSGWVRQCVGEAWTASRPKPNSYPGGTALHGVWRRVELFAACRYLHVGQPTCPRPCPYPCPREWQCPCPCPCNCQCPFICAPCRWTHIHICDTRHRFSCHARHRFSCHARRCTWRCTWRCTRSFNYPCNRGVDCRALQERLRHARRCRCAKWPARCASHQCPCAAGGTRGRPCSGVIATIRAIPNRDVNGHPPRHRGQSTHCPGAGGKTDTPRAMQTAYGRGTTHSHRGQMRGARDSG